LYHFGHPPVNFRFPGGIGFRGAGVQVLGQTLHQLYQLLPGQLPGFFNDLILGHWHSAWHTRFRVGIQALPMAGATRNPSSGSPVSLRRRERNGAFKRDARVGVLAHGHQWVADQRPVQKTVRAGLAVE